MRERIVCPSLNEMLKNMRDITDGTNEPFRAQDAEIRCGESQGDNSMAHEILTEVFEG